jgi:fucose 4-O-acetylase-like acetyltransferase
MSYQIRKLDSVSIAKAIAIILMVVAHTNFSVFGGKIINMFHMPLFFFFAGFCFKEHYLQDAKSFLVKRIKGLYLPYVKWSLIFLAFHNVFFRLNFYNNEYVFRGKISHEYELYDFFINAVHIITGMSGHERLLGAFWFLKTLLLASIIAFCAIKYIKKSFVIIAVILLVSIVLSYFNKHVPFVDIGAKELLGAFFFYVGYLYKKKGAAEQGFMLYPFAIVVLILGTIFWQMGLLHIVYWKIVPWVISAVIGILCCYKLSLFLERKQFKGKKILIYIGDNSLDVLIWHFVCFKIVSLLIIFLYGLPIECLAEFPVILEYSTEGWWGVYSFVGIFVPIALKMLIDKMSVRNKRDPVCPIVRTLFL